MVNTYINNEPMHHICVETMSDMDKSYYILKHGVTFFENELANLTRYQRFTIVASAVLYSKIHLLKRRFRSLITDIYNTI